MKHILVYPLSLYVDTKQSRAIDAFAEMRLSTVPFLSSYKWVSKLSLLWNWSTLNKEIFDPYRKGNISTSKFRQKVGRKYPNAVKDEEAFDAAWNSMSVVTEENQRAFREFHEVILDKESDIELYAYSSTNELHIKHINKEIDNGIPGIPFWSYKKNLLGIQLVRGLLNKIKKDHPDIKKDQISFLYQEAGPMPYAKWGFLGWFIAPFARLEHLGAQKFVAALKNEAKRNPLLNLKACSPNEEGNIAKILQTVDNVNRKDRSDAESYTYDIHELGPTYINLVTPPTHEEASSSEASALSGIRSRKRSSA